MISAIEDDDPVIFFEPKRLYNGPFDGDHKKAALKWDTHPKGEVPEEYYSIPIGEASIEREGSQLTVLCYGTMVHVAREAVKLSGIDAEIIDLRSLVPLDIDAITKSIEKTGRCVIVHEAPKTSGFGGELSAQIQESCFYHLEAPITRVTGWDTPFPHSLEWYYFPSQERVIEAMKKTMES